MVGRRTQCPLQQRFRAMRIALPSENDCLLDDEQGIVRRAVECRLQCSACARDIADGEPRQRLQKAKAGRRRSCCQPLFGNTVAFARQSEHRQRAAPQIPPFFGATSAFPHRIERGQGIASEIAQQRAARLLKPDFQRDRRRAPARGDGVEGAKKLVEIQSAAAEWRACRSTDRTRFLRGDRDERARRRHLPK